MDVRETTELDEDERTITIADGSDTGIVNNQVPEADIIKTAPMRLFLRLPI